MKKQIKENQHFCAAMYLRLSRDDEDKDGIFKSESNSISGQRELIRSFLQEQKDMELFDVYVDDGYSGSNFDRPELKRMIGDIEAGRVNCVIVKDLSRFGRDYIETGRYLEKVFPKLNVRFIAVTDHYDSFSADAGERTIVVPVKNFINDSYCRDISMKIKSQLAAKRKAGEYVASFALYGYKKDEKNRNKLVIDEYAAGIVRRIYDWKIEGMAVSAIAGRLNELGILSPKEYKKSNGENYRGGFANKVKTSWSGATVKRILTDETYLGHLLQGKTEKINYKIKGSTQKPREEWVRVENTHEPIISQDSFNIVQNLMKADSRISVSTREIGVFTGLLFCGDCHEQMIRRISRYKGTCKVYYICSTNNRGDGCSRHSIEENVLKELVQTALCSYVNSFMEQSEVFDQNRDYVRDHDTILEYSEEVKRLRKEQEKYYNLCSGLHEDLRKGIVTEQEFERLKKEFRSRAAAISEALAKQEEFIKELLLTGAAAVEKFRSLNETMELSKIDRYVLVSLVKRIYIFEGKKLEIEFYFQDQYRAMAEVNQRLSCLEEGDPV